MRLRDFALRAVASGAPPAGGEAHRFDLATRCVTALFERCFPEFTGSRGWKVLVECAPAVQAAGVTDLLGVLTVQRALDVRAFLAADPAAQKRLALDVLWAGILEVADHEGWPLEPFEQARRAVLGCNLRNAWTWPRRPVCHPGTRHRALLHCEHEPDAFRATIVVTARGGRELLRHRALEEWPSDAIYAPRLGALAWTAPDRIALRARDGSTVAEVAVPGLALP